MITQEIRERMENIIKCIQAKLEGKTLEWYDSARSQWITIDKDDWCFTTTSKLRIAPEPQEKLKRWAVFNQGKLSATFSTLYEAEEYAKREPVSDCIIELTETARIEPKKREPRRIWHNRYGGQWGLFAFTSAEHARAEADTGQSTATETAVEFVEVVKGASQPITSRA